MNLLSFNGLVYHSVFIIVFYLLENNEVTNYERIDKMNPQKDSCMLVDIQYVKPNRKNNTPDYLYIIWKDLDTMEKHLQVVPEPKMDIYFEKPEFRTFNYNKNYEHIEKLDKKTVKCKDIIFAIADDMGENGRNALNNIFQTKNYSALKNFYLYPYTFGSDYDAVGWYRVQWLRKLNNSRTKILSKGFLDIEADGLEVKGMPDPRTCPINAVTLANADKSEVYTFILTDRPCVEKDTAHMTENEKKKEYERREMYAHMHEEQHYMMDHPEELIDELHELFDDFYGVLDYKLYFYSDEKKMLIHLFQLINILKLDMIGIWNISFDIPYIRDRMIALGLDPSEIMSHPDFPVKKCYFKEDTINHDIKNKSDIFHLTSYTIFYDQMELYASIRKGGSKLRSYRLNVIANNELKDTKLDYSEDGDIKTLPYLNFRKFIIYNIKDVLLQLGIERKTSDFDTLYASSYLNATPYDKVSRQTCKLRNAEYLSFLEQGLIPGNNTNIYNQDKDIIEDDDDDEDDDSFDGALVADPRYNGKVGQKMYGQPTNNLFLNGIDMDMSAFYPNSIIGCNIDQSTLIFKLILPISQYDIFNGELQFRGITGDAFEDASVDGAKECIDNFQTGNYMTFGSKWMNMPDVYEVYNQLVKTLGR